MYISNVKHDKHNTRIMFYDYVVFIYASLPDKRKKTEKVAFLNEFGYIIFREGGGGGGVNHPFCLTFLHLIYHVYKCFILLYCHIPLHTYRAFI